jgi:thioredoxin reductase
VLLGHALGTAFGERMAGLHRNRGVDIVCGVTVTGLDAADGAVRGVSLSDGSYLEADVVLVSIGSLPATDWLTSSGLDVAAGVVCDSTCAVVGAQPHVAHGRNRTRGVGAAAVGVGVGVRIAADERSVGDAVPLGGSAAADETESDRLPGAAAPRSL